MIRHWLLVFLISVPLSSVLGASGVVILEKRDSRWNVFQLVKNESNGTTSYTLVKRDKNGRFEWSVKAWEQQGAVAGSDEFGFLITVGKDGSLISKWLIRKGDPGIRLGLFLQRNTVSAILNLNDFSAARGALEPFDQAVEREESTLKQQYYPKVCGILAFLKVMNTDQQQTNGAEIFRLITSKEPDFPNRCPKISKGLTELGKVSHDTGRIKVEMEDYVNIDNVRVFKDAEFSIVQGEGGNMRLVVERGIMVTKSIGFTFKKPLNFVEISAGSGMLEFNYGSNKSKKVLIDEILKK